MQIYGSKKGQGKQRQPVIAPDSAQSKTYINMLFGLGEGEIAGLANGYKSVYLDDTPLQNDNGEFNFPNVKVDFRNGTTDQTYIDGFPDVASETAVNVELKHGTPFIKAFNNLDLDALRVRLKWGALRSQNAENGDVSGVKIDYAIDLKTDNGGWVQVLSPSINAKTSDAYERSHRIDLPPATTGWQVRVRRLTPNSTSDLVSDRMFVSAITEVIDLKLRYPNTALLGLRCDATSFNNVPKMSARCKGLIIKVPTNYDPVTRTYTGLWNGEFKLAYSNNPAWVYYDLCTNTRYGLGNRLTPAMIDKWSLYRLAQHCDEQVSDGMGGQEPRFTVNVYIQSSEGAFELLSKLAGVFRAISYWDGNSIVVDADIPQDSIYSFSRANVIDGVFEYTGTRARDRHTVAKVAWDNPANHFKTEYEFVRDEQAITKFGTNIAEISAWGCTSKGQAQRAGLWALKSEQLETRMVTFKVGLDGYIPSPAKVIEISDELFAGRANGGRVLAINKNKTVITLDRPISAKANDTLVINGDDGFSQRRLIKSINGDKITVTKAFTNISVENVWVLDSQDLATMKFRVLSVTADENHQFTITAVQYNPDKYDAIDTGAYIDERPISVINPVVQAPTKSVNLSSYHTINQGVSITTLVIGWEQVTGAVKYAVQWRKDNGNWQTLPPTGTNSIEVAGVYAGQYEAQVTAISAFGQASIATQSALTTIAGKQGKPNKLARLTAQGVLFGMNLAWSFNRGSEDTNFTEIEVSPDGRSNITTLGTFAYPTNKHEITGLQGGLTQFYRGRIVDKLGNTSDWTAWVRGVTDNQAEKVLNLIGGQINESHLHQNLSTPIAKIGTLETDLNGVKTQLPNIRTEITNAKTTLQNAIDAVNSQLPTLNSQIATLNGKATTLQNELNTAKNTLQTAISNITTERNRISGAIRDITALQADKNAKTQELANLTQTVNGHTSSIRELGVTTGDLSQKYTALKTATDTANSEITAIKQTQAGQAVEQSRLSARFDSLSVGGRNYITESATDRAVGGNRRYIIYNTTLTELTQPAIFSAYVKDVVGNNGNHLTVVLADKSNINATAEQIQNVEIVNGRIIAKFNPPNNPSKTSVLVYANSGGWGGSATGSVTYYNAKLELGDVVTDWTPAPEDIQSEIDAKASSASLDEFKQTSANADNALSQRISTLDAQYKKADTDLTARLAREEAARASGDNANAQALRTLESTVQGVSGRVGTSESKIATLERTTSDTNQALATAQSQLNARFDSLSVGGRNYLAASALERTAGDTNRYIRYDGQMSSLDKPFVFSAYVKDIAGNVGNCLTVALVDKTNPNASIEQHQDVQIVDGRIIAKFIAPSTPNKTSIIAYANSGGWGGSVTGSVTYYNAKLELGTMATDWTPAPEDVQTAIDGKASTASLDEFKRTQAQKDTAAAGRLSQLESGLGTKANAAALDSLTTKVNQVDNKLTAESQKLSTLQTAVNGQTASIQQHAQSLNGLEAQWTLKVQSGNIVSGIGLASNDGVSDFAVRADKFYIAPPTGTGKGSTPFAILTTSQTINGVQVPAGTYIKSAYIQNGSITTAKLADASIDNAKIKNGVIDSAKIANGAITTAKIGTAQIDTLQIKGEAVVVPRLQYSPQDFEFYTIDTEEEINRVTIDAKGGAVSLQFTFEKLTARSGGNNDGSNGAVIFRIKRGSTTLRTIRFEGGMVSHTTTSGYGDRQTTRTNYYKQLNYEFITLATLIDTPPSGNQVYTVTLESRGLNSGKSKADKATYPVVIKARSFHLLGVRR